MGTRVDKSGLWIFRPPQERKGPSPEKAAVTATAPVEIIARPEDRLADGERRQ